MAIKKTELYASLWKSCDELRGGMDASQYKDYVLTLLFLKYISDKSKQDPDSLIEVPEGCTFDDIVKLKNNKEIGEKLNIIITAIAKANELQGVIDQTDFNDEEKLGSGKDMIDRLTKLIANFETLNLASNKADGDDLLGDAYEYLMRHFATESGKSKGQFYTPAEVSRIMAKIIGIEKHITNDKTVYDPTCGSGSLLLKASDESTDGLDIYGQEKDTPTSGLAKMNMLIHGVITATIVDGNTFANPKFTNGDKLKTFDFAVANPPFSSKNWTNGIEPTADIYHRFDLGIPPDKNGDYAFLLHLISSLKTTGKGAIILPHGVLFRGNAEARIRENILKLGYIKGIIGLPANLFYGTGIPACIIVLDKEHGKPATLDDNGNVIDGQSVFMIDASRGFIKDGNKNRLRHQDIHKIVDTFNNRKQQDHFSRMVAMSEIVANDYNLNIPRYIPSPDNDDLQDLTAHLQGGIPVHDVEALSHYWQVFTSLKDKILAKDSNRYKLITEIDAIKNLIYSSDDFTKFVTTAKAPFEQWQKDYPLSDITHEEKPKEFIHRISEGLLASYQDTPLISQYDIYQILMDYWDNIMQDDVYLIHQNGWEHGKQLEHIVKKGESYDIVVDKEKYKSDLIPANLVIHRFFAKEQQAIDDLTAKLEQAELDIESMLEEHGGDEGVLNDVITLKESQAALEGYQLQAWDSIDKQRYKTYRETYQAMLTLEEEISQLAKDSTFNGYRSKAGVVSVKDVKAKLKTELQDSQSFASIYIRLDGELKKAKKHVSELKSAMVADIKKLKQQGKTFEHEDDIVILEQFIGLLKEKDSVKKQLNTAIQALHQQVFIKYSQLTVEEIKVLLVDDKWLATIEQNIDSEIERVVQALVTRLTTLAERYAVPLPAMTAEVERLNAIVAGHLAKMGLEF